MAHSRSKKQLETIAGATVLSQTTVANANAAEMQRSPSIKIGSALNAVKARVSQEYQNCYTSGLASMTRADQSFKLAEFSRTAGVTVLSLTTVAKRQSG